MKLVGLMVLLLAVAPLSAQRFETGLFIGQQQYDSYQYGVRGGSVVGYAPDANRVVAGRFGVSVADLGPARLQVSLGYQPETSTSVQSPNRPASELKYSYGSLGVGLSMTTLVALGATLELRSETLDGNTWNRAWLRFNLSYTFPSVGIKPFLGVETASALATRSVSYEDSYYGTDNWQGMAPKSQFGVYAGARF